MVMLLRMMLALVAPARIGVVVNPRVTCQFIGTRKLFATSRILAGVRLLARVSANMPRLVLEPVESLVTERAFVRTREFIRRLGSLGARKRPVGFDNGD